MRPSLPPPDPFSREIAPPPRRPTPPSRAFAHRKSARAWLRRGATGVVALVLALGFSNRIGPDRLSAPQDRHLALTLGVWRAPRADRSALEAAGQVRRTQAWNDAAPPEYDIVESNSLVELARRGVACVLVSDARDLGDAELAELERYLRDGGGVVVAGEIAVTRRDGQPDYERMRQMLGVDEIVRVDPAETGEITLRAWRRGSMTAELSPGELVPLERRATRLGVRKSSATLGWFEDDRPSGLAASHRVERGAGRLAWLAAHPADRFVRAPGLSSHYDPMARLVRGAVAWAGRQPMLEILPWPSAAPFAATWENDSPAPPVEIAALRAELAAHAAHARSTAGRAVFSLPRALPAPDRQALREFGERLLRDQGAWIASESEVSRWSLVRSGLVAAFEQPTADTLLIYVSNRSRQDLDGAVLRVHANQALGAARIQRQEAGGGEVVPANATIALVHGADSFDLELPALPAGKQRAYQIQFENVRAH